MYDPEDQVSFVGEVENTSNSTNINELLLFFQTFPLTYEKIYLTQKANKRKMNIVNLGLYNKDSNGIDNDRYIGYNKKDPNNIDNDRDICYNKKDVLGNPACYKDSANRNSILRNDVYKRSFKRSMKYGLNIVNGSDRRKVKDSKNDLEDRKKVKDSKNNLEVGDINNINNTSQQGKSHFYDVDECGQYNGNYTDNKRSDCGKEGSNEMIIDLKNLNNDDINNGLSLNNGDVSNRFTDANLGTSKDIIRYDDETKYIKMITDKSEINYDTPTFMDYFNNSMSSEFQESSINLQNNHLFQTSTVNTFLRFDNNTESAKLENLAFSPNSHRRSIRDLANISDLDKNYSSDERVKSSLKQYFGLAPIETNKPSKIERTKRMIKKKINSIHVHFAKSPIKYKTILSGIELSSTNSDKV